ncbi:MAG: Y-family DNA polymerase [Synergistaceae bacterium]
MGLVDCNNFFVSCERRADPSLQNRPVVVLSNNDGCVVSRSNEVKKLGVKTGDPYFKIKYLLKQINTVVRSSNMNLYKKVSFEVMSTIASFSDKTEVYSIDESFLNLAICSVDDPVSYARNLRLKIWKDCSIPVSIGIAPTKTLAKLGSEYAKTHRECNGVFWLNADVYQDREFMSAIRCSEVWGIGRKTSEKLALNRVYTTYDLCQCDDMWLKKNFSVATLFSKWELKGQCAYPILSDNKPPKSIMVSRSFGDEIRSFDDILDPLLCFTVSAASQLRKSGQCATKLTVFIATNRFGGDSYYTNSREFVFDSPRFSDVDFMNEAVRMLKEIYADGFIYKKCGVIISGLQDCSAARQSSLFPAENDDKDKSLSSAVDKLNLENISSLIKPAALFSPPNCEKKWAPKSEFHGDKKEEDSSMPEGLRFQNHAEDFAN